MRKHFMSITAAAALTTLLCTPFQLHAQVRFSQLGRLTPINSKIGSLQLRVADFNGDGFRDLAVLDVIGGIQIWLGDAARNYRRGSNVALFGAFDLRTGDFDGDGDTDLLAVVAGNTGLRMFANDGTGRFTDASSRVPRVPNAAYVRVADIDKDGDPDLVVPAGAASYTLLENRAGTFRNVSQRILSKPFVSIAHAVHDVDQDGRLDLVAVSTGEVVILLQDANGNFGQRPLRVKIDSRPMTIALADVDKDGDTDFFLGVQFGRDAFFEARGLTWIDASATRLPSPPRGLSMRDARFVDIDDDGDADLIVPKASANAALRDRTRVYVNDGRGRFSDATASVLGAQPTISNDVLVEDFDGDGDADIGMIVIQGTREELLVEHNLRRHVAGPTTARINTTLPIDLYAAAGFAPAGQLSLPFVSLTPARRALPVLSFGALGLDLAGLVALPAQLHPIGSGKVTMNLPLPNNAALAGRTLYAQALVLHDPRTPSSWRLTNVHSTALTR